MQLPYPGSDRTETTFAELCHWTNPPCYQRCVAIYRVSGVEVQWAIGYRCWLRVVNKRALKTEHSRKAQSNPAIPHRVGDKVNPSEFIRWRPAAPVRGENSLETPDNLQLWFWTGIFVRNNFNHVSIGCSSKLTLYGVWRGNLDGLRVREQDKAGPRPFSALPSIYTRVAGRADSFHITWS